MVSFPNFLVVIKKIKNMLKKYGYLDKFPKSDYT